MTRARPPTLYFFHLSASAPGASDGCEACEEAAPALARFEKAHPEIRVVRVDIARVRWRVPWTVRLTPTYGWLAPDAARLRLREGVHTRKELEAWIRS